MPRRARNALLGALGALGLLILTWYLAFHVELFKRADQSIFRGFYDLHHRPRLATLARFVATLCDPKPYVYLAAVPVLVALVRRRPRVAIAIGAVLLGANETTQLLKPVLAQPRPNALLGGVALLPPGSWPSGHATAAMSLALCCVLAVPARLRPATATLGAAFAVAVSYSFLSLGWHYPSDVFGGYLIAATWTLVALAALSTAEATWPRNAAVVAPRGRVSIASAIAPPAALLVGVLALAGLLALARPHQVIAYARAHEAFVVGAGAIGVLALTVATGIMLALRR